MHHTHHHHLQQEAYEAQLKHRPPFCCVSFSAEIPSKELRPPHMALTLLNTWSRFYTPPTPTRLGRPSLCWMPKFSIPPSSSPPTPYPPPLHPSTCSTCSSPNLSEGGANSHLAFCLCRFLLCGDALLGAAELSWNLLWSVLGWGKKGGQVVFLQLPSLAILPVSPVPWPSFLCC